MLFGLQEPIFVALRILELERVFGFDLDGEFRGGTHVEKFQQPFAAIDAHVMTTFRTHVQIALDLGTVEHRVASRTLGPQAFGHRARAALGLDTRGDNSLEPGHGLY
jgi:hypothetical protein